MNRRHALQTIALSAGAAAPAFSLSAKDPVSTGDPWLKLAVQQYSFNRELKSGALAMNDYPKTVVEGTGIKALEYFNGHMEELAGNAGFFKELRKRTDDLGAVNTMMLCRSKAALDSPDPAVRAAAIEGYRPWLEAMQILGGQCIRVDVRSGGDAEEQKRHAVAGLKSLTAVAESEYELGIVVENHGGHSSNGAWIAEVMKGVAMEGCGTLPDFQNFKEYDPYLGVEEMMPWAKIVCAKAKSFDAEGNEANVDYRRMLKIVKDSGFSGYIGIEFEGHEVSPIEGIKLTKNLIERVMEEMA
ncbi:MAG: TIM barrel protein [Verrucomicrobiales bacterium]|nr:TIM barrel protein [Verrucomicrobiales bacterium]